MNYVFHCKRCMVMVAKDARDGMETCPKRQETGKLKEMIRTRQGSMVNFPDYKCDRNYPQRAPNLPGEPVVQSYKHYQDLCRKHGQFETGVSDRSRKTNARRKRKGIRTTWDKETRA